MPIPLVVKSDCRACSRMTRHEILFEELVEQSGFFNEKDTWQVIRCLGCLTISFRHRHDDFDAIETDAKGETTHDIVVSVYPGVIRDHRKLHGAYFLPPLISRVYFQTLKALSERAFVLASIGLRACIEAVCNHLELSGTNLERRIDQLFKAGHVSNGDKKRLHAIRFLGNDAAHEIKEPKPGDIRIALEIVEHLLNTVFILESRAKSLETVAETYEDFLKLVQAQTARHEAGKKISLAALLGRQRRLVGQLLDSFEGQLKGQIAIGSVPFLTLAQTEPSAGKVIQLYELHPALAKTDDDIPF